MSEEKKLREELGLDDDALDAVIGGIGGTGEAVDPPAPMPTGAVAYTCQCGCTINANTRDMTVTCPKCKRKYQLKKGKLVLT